MLWFTDGSGGESQFRTFFCSSASEVILASEIDHPDVKKKRTIYLDHILRYLLHRNYVGGQPHWFMLVS